MGKECCGIPLKAMGTASRGCSTIELLPHLACQPKLSRSKPRLRAMRLDAAVFAGRWVQRAKAGGAGRTRTDNRR